MLKKQSTSSVNRVERSTPYDSYMHNTYTNNKNSEESQDSVSENSEDLGIDADDLNKALGIEARGSPPKKFENLPFLNLLNLKPKDDVLENLETPNDQSASFGVRRHIQHYQTFIQPIFPASFNTPSLTANVIPSQHQMIYNNNLLKLNENVQLMDNRIYDVHSPIIMSNPFNAVWTAFTNIVEYGPEADIHKRPEAKTRQKRETSTNDYHEFFIEDYSRSGDGGPKIMKLKVRRGGVAIAGPGGIATAGSGGTAIVGPGGTAYTTPDGTAVVGPGGRVIEIPAHTPTQILSRADEPFVFQFPTNGKVVANGPVVYRPGRPHNPTPVERL